MPKKRERSESEYVKSQIRSLEAENKALRKALARANKLNRQYSDATSAPTDDATMDTEGRQRESSETVSHYCPNCKKEIDPPKDLGGRIMISCGACRFRRTYAKEGIKREET